MSLATLLDRNKAFAATDAVAKNPQIPWLPSQLTYIITCIDSRTEPASFLGVDLGDATVQRTVGGRVTPAVLRDVAYISYLTETKTPDGPWWELAVIHHTDCGSTLLADPELRRGFAARGGYIEAELAWLPATDPAATVRAARQAMRLALVQVGPPAHVTVGQREHRLGLGQQVQVQVGFPEVPRLHRERVLQYH
jgi:carbonic anhydrase